MGLLCLLRLPQWLVDHPPRQPPSTISIHGIQADAPHPLPVLDTPIISVPEERQPWHAHQHKYIDLVFFFHILLSEHSGNCDSQLPHSLYIPRLRRTLSIGVRHPFLTFTLSLYTLARRDTHTLSTYTLLK